MNEITSLKDVVCVNDNFKTSVNLYLNLNKHEKILSYIPTKSSVDFLGEYVKAVCEGKEQATLMIGPYGKGKSHLLLVLLAILTMERNEENTLIIEELISKINLIDEESKSVSESILSLWGKNRFLPVLVTDTTGDLNQSFLFAMNDALKRNGLLDLVPNTYYTIALDRISDWETNYPDNYNVFIDELRKHGTTIEELKTNLTLFSKNALELFQAIYPLITAGSKFNPMTLSDVLPLYKSISDKLVDEYNYSGIYIVFDEFSKYIESLDGNAAGEEMKLVQNICELAVNSDDSKIHFTMVAHKSIKEYGRYLSQDIINSFTGIEGRLLEKTFIASSKNNYELIKSAIKKNEEKICSLPNYEELLGDKRRDCYYQLPAFKSSFVLSDFEKILFKGCFPLNPIASYLLLNISEKVAQNERTLFTFISNDEPHSMARYIAEHTSGEKWSIGVDLIYDYFSSLFKKDVIDENTHSIWLSAEYALAKCESFEQKKMIKALAVILIVNKEDEIPATNKYLQLAVDTNDSSIIHSLESSQLIYKKGSTGCYVFKTRAGAVLQSEIEKQRGIKGESTNCSKMLLEITGNYYTIPRKYNTLYSMTRYFANQYMLASDFLRISNSEILLDDCSGDGKVVTIYDYSIINQDEIKRHVAKLANPRLLIICPEKPLSIKNQLVDYEIVFELSKNEIFISENEILIKELPLMLDDLSIEIERDLSDVYESKETRIFYYDGSICSERIENEESVISKVCENVYPNTPIINNEMVNRSNIYTAATKKARINVISAILSHRDTPDFYSGTNQEASIYRSLFCVTKILDDKPEYSIRCILDEISGFIDSCSKGKNKVADLITTLTASPYGMRVGVIPFYMAYIFSRRKEDVVVYFVNKEVSLTADIVVNMCEHPDDYELFISKDDFAKEKYIDDLNCLFRVGENRNLSVNRIENIFICMQRWYRALPQVSRNMLCLDEFVKSPTDADAMKSYKKLLQRVDFNAFETVFVDLPSAFSDSSLNETYQLVVDCKSYFDMYFDWVVSKVIDIIYSVWNKEKNDDLYHVLKEWYEEQSFSSKQSLAGGQMTVFMTAISSLNVFNDYEVAQKVAKALNNVYIEDWNIGSLESFELELSKIKHEIESIKNETSDGEMTLTFTTRDGGVFEKSYTHASEGTGSILRNILEDTLDEFDDLSVNDRVSILLEMIEKITK